MKKEIKLLKYQTPAEPLPEYYDVINPSVVTATLPSINTKQGERIAKNIAYRVANGEANLSNVPRKYYNYVQGEVQGAMPVTKAINEAGEKGMPYAVGAAFGPAGLASVLLGEGINTMVNGFTHGEKQKWGDLFVDPEKHPVWNTILDLTNPGYLLMPHEGFRANTKNLYNVRALNRDFASRRELIKIVNEGLKDGIRNFTGNTVKDATGLMARYIPHKEPLSTRQMPTRPISEAELRGVPKGERKLNIHETDPYYWTYEDWQKKYLEAIESGDPQKIRDLHWKYKAPDAYDRDFLHATNFDFNTFEIQYPSEQFFHFFDASDLGAPGETGRKRELIVRLNAKNPRYVRDPRLWNWSMMTDKNPSLRRDLASMPEFQESVYEAAPYLYPELQRAPNEVTEKLGKLKQKIMKKLDYDAFVYPNDYERDGIMSYAIPDPKQIKLSDAITYDDAGNIIPIVKRDNFHVGDIRYKTGGKLKRRK